MKKEANRIREWRKKRGLSQTELGQVMNPPCGKSKINKIEKGSQNLNQKDLMALSRALHCDISELLNAAISGDIAVGYQKLSALSPEQEALGIANNLAAEIKGISPEARHLLPDFILPVLGIRPQAHMIIPVQPEVDRQKGALAQNK